jgi:hypothetical protein
MAGDVRVGVVLTGDATGAVAAEKAVTTGLNKVGDAGKQAGAKVEGGLKQTAGAIGTTGEAIEELVDTLAGLATMEAMRRFVVEVLDAARQAENTFRGLEAVANHSGLGIGKAFAVAAKLSEDGLLSVGQASQALQNLLSRKYSEADAVNVLNRLKDAAAFNRQAHLSLGEAVVTATEGLKNENSTLVDNAGVTKNVAKMWEEYAGSIGTTAEKLTQAQKIQAEVNGIMAETAAQVGNAKKALEGVEGQLASTGQAWAAFSVGVGGNLQAGQAAAAGAAGSMVRDVLAPMAAGWSQLRPSIQAVTDAIAAYVEAAKGGEPLSSLYAPEHLHGLEVCRHHRRLQQLLDRRQPGA